MWFKNGLKAQKLLALYLSATRRCPLVQGVWGKTCILQIDFIRYQRKEIKHFIRCHRIKSAIFILYYRINFVLLPQKVSIWKRNCFER